MFAAVQLDRRPMVRLIFGEEVMGVTRRQVPWSAIAEAKVE